MKKSIIINIIFWLLTFIIIMIGFYIPSSYSSTTYSRSDLQKYVVETAIGFYNNNQYSDYEQHSMNESKTYNWNNFIISPEGLSRSNNLTTSCAAFCSLSYIYSINDTFKDYSAYSGYNYSGITYDDMLFNLGYGPSTRAYNKIAKNISKITAYYHNVVLDSNYNYKESDSERKAVINKIKSLLEPGDIFTVRRIQNGETKGHAMLYVGDYLNGKKGFIHSTGYDFTIKGDTISIGDDASLSKEKDKQAIRFNTIDEIFEKQLYTNYKSSNRATSEISILRPLNKYCGNTNTCSGVDLNINAKGRFFLKGLIYEQYISEKNGSTHKTINSNYNSINNGDTITYNMLLKYNKKSFDNIKISANIPSNSELIECISEVTDKSGKKITDKYKCNVSNKKVTWSNISVNSDNKEVLLKLRVRNNNESKIVFNGYTISKKETIKMESITTNVNPTLNSLSGKKVIDNYKKYTGSSCINYISNLYKGVYGIDLSYLSFDKIKNSIFKDDKRLTKTQSSSLTGNSKIIDQMLVPGLYGGLKVKGNTRNDRVRFVKTTLLERGDILVTYKGSKKISYLFLGFDDKNVSHFSTISSGKVTLVKGYDTFKKVIAKDYFVVLRPSRVYGSTVVYNYNNNQKKNVEYTVFANNTFGKLYSPKRKNYIFDGWFLDKSLTKKVTKNTSLSKDKTINVYAKWTKVDTKYTVKHFKQNVNDDKYTLSNTDVYSGETGKKITAILRDYTGFTKPSEKTITLNSSGKQVIEYYYKRNSYKLNLLSGTGISSVSGAGTYKYWSNVTIDATVKDGYTFSGWYENDNRVCENKKCKLLRKASNNTFTAKAKENTYVITFDMQKGNSGTTTTEVKYSKELKKITIPKREGYVFLGYYSEKNGTGTKYYNEEGTGLKAWLISNNKTLYAHWKAINYIVTYDSNGGTGSMSNSTHTYGVKKALNENTFKKSGYYFLGWNKKKEEKNAKYKDKQEVSSLTIENNKTVTLYAIWTPIEQVKYRVIHYKQNVNDDDYYINENEYFYALDNTEVSPSVKSYSGFSSPISKTITIKSGNENVIKYYYKRLSYKVTILKDEGIKSVSGSGTYKYLSNFTLNAIVKDGYTFVNYTKVKDNKELTKQRIATYRKGDSNSEFKANTRPNKYKVEYDGNGSTSGTMPSSSFTYNVKGKLQENKFEKENCIFKGWSTNKESSDIEYNDKASLMNLSITDEDTITLYAIWEEKEENIIIVAEEESEEEEEENDIYSEDEKEVINPKTDNEPKKDKSKKPIKEEEKDGDTEEEPTNEDINSLIEVDEEPLIITQNNNVLKVYIPIISIVILIILIVLFKIFKKK